MKFSTRGQTPYIELDGKQYPDSNLVMDMLRKNGLIRVDPEEAAGVGDKKELTAIAHMARSSRKKNCYNYDCLHVGKQCLSILKGIYPSSGSRYL